MEEFRKIDLHQLLRFWKVLAFSLVMIIVMLTVCRIVPIMLSTGVALACAGIIYVVTIGNRSRGGNCILVPHSVILSMVLYCIVSVSLNAMHAFEIVCLPDELIFYQGQYIPSLIYMPVGMISFMFMYMRRNQLKMCVSCKLEYGDKINRNRLHAIFRYESHLQLKYLVILFGVLSLLVWTYFIFFYVRLQLTERDHYVFIWLIVLAFAFEEIYFAIRYYNLYLDLEAADEIIDPETLENRITHSYVRFYVIFKNEIFVNPDTKEEMSKYGKAIDTPFFIRREESGISLSDLKHLILDMTGVKGELRFFYGRKFGRRGHGVLRYFYFVDSYDNQSPKIKEYGEWMNFTQIKQIYSTDPAQLAPLFVQDTTRLSTIMLTSKKYDERGFRRNKIQSYVPTFDLIDVRKSTINFQDDKWIRVSMFNSDTSFFRLKRILKRIIGQSF